MSRQLEPANHFPPPKRISLENFVSLLTDVEVTTVLLGRKSEPMTENADFLTAGSVAKQNSWVDANDPQSEISVMTTAFKEDILARRKMSL